MEVVEEGGMEEQREFDGVGDDASMRFGEEKLEEQE